MRAPIRIVLFVVAMMAASLSIAGPAAALVASPTATHLFASPNAGAGDYGYPYLNAPDCNEQTGDNCAVDSWNFFQGQCTSWVAFRLNSVNGVPFTNRYRSVLWGDATGWGAAARSLGIAVDDNPAVGAVVWYSSGHVGYVEQVNGDGSVAMSEMNFDYHNGFRLTTIARSNRWPSSFIHVQDMAGNGTPADGQFISYQGNVYRIAGGAPIYVSSWNVFGGERSTTAFTDAQWQALRWFPADGTLVSTGSPNAVYRFAGGAPIYVSNWDRIGGIQPYTQVDGYSLEHFSNDGVFSHVRRYPADGTIVNTDLPNAVYRFAGGAPIYVSNWDRIGGIQPYTQVDGYSLEHFSNDGVFSHVRQYPADGTHLRGSPSGLTYQVTGGVPSYSPVPSTSTGVLVDDAAIDHDGGDGIWMHLKARAAVSGSAPTIVGSAIVGSTLSVVAGAWQPAPVALAYQWLRNGAPLPGATAFSYQLSADDLGLAISVTVTGSRLGYRNSSTTSAPTTPVSQPATPPGAGSGGDSSGSNGTGSPNTGSSSGTSAGTSAGTGAGASTGTTGTPAGGGIVPVSAPAGVSAATVTFPAKKTAVLSWTAPGNTTSYQVRVSKRNSTKKWGPWTTVTTAPVRITKLTKKATYRVQIIPIGPGGTGATTTWKFKQKK